MQQASDELGARITSVPVFISVPSTVGCYGGIQQTNLNIAAYLSTNHTHKSVGHQTEWL